MATIRIAKSKVKQMIKEEYAKKITEIKLKNRLSEINEEMKRIISEGEEENIEEVKVGGTQGVRSTGWTGENGGDKKWEPNFEKKGSHLVEDENSDNEEIEIDEPEIDEPTDDDMDIDMDTDMDTDIDTEIEDDDINAILAQLADAIETKIDTAIEDKLGNSNASDENIDEVPAESPEDTMEIPDENNEPADNDDDNDDLESEEPVNEQDGTSVAQEQKPKNAIPYNNGKANIPKSDQIVSESTKKRMKILSGIIRNDFND